MAIITRVANQWNSLLLLYVPTNREILNENILMVLTSYDQLTYSETNAGFWPDEFAAPCYVFTDAGATITLASPLGGQLPTDPIRDDPDAQTEATYRFKVDPATQTALACKLQPESIKAEEFDAAFYSGGHGPRWGLVEDTASNALTGAALAAGSPLAAVYPAPPALRHLESAEGDAVLYGKAVTGLSNMEEAPGVVPFMTKEMFTRNESGYSKAASNKCRGQLFAGRKATVSIFYLLATLLATNHVAHADELGIMAGSLDGYRSLALAYQTAPVWQAVLADHPLEVSLEYSLGMVRATDGQSNRNLTHIGLTPFARWWFASNTGAELGIGANVFSGTHLGKKDLSTAFQFGSSIGLVHRFQDTPWQLGLRLTHYSNASIKEPNPGQDYIQLRASYRFP